MTTDGDIVNQNDIRRLFKRDNLFVEIHRRYGSPPNWSRPQGFVSLAKMILEQQVSLASAHAHFLKLNGYIASFEPENILRLSDQEMRLCQISRQKATYLRALSNAVQDRSLIFELLPKIPENEAMKQLTSVKGIGSWTAEVYLMFCLQAKDIFPMGDIALINTVKELKEIPNREAIYLQSKKWKPCRSLAAYFLWHYYLSKRNRTSV